MGITATQAQYESAIKKLFPQGEYWDNQFRDPESDISLFVKAKAEELFRFRSRMNKLYNESRVETTDELIADWELVLLGELNAEKTLEQRREFIKSQVVTCLNRATLQKIAEIYGFNIIDISLHRPAFFGSSRFGANRIASPAYWQVICISVDTRGNSDRVAQFETFLRSVSLANHSTQFSYIGGQ
jgi:uncharacterized protein YmfQ (DUF2313 family)